MKKVSLVQVNFQQGPQDLNAYYLPYSVGCIWSYAYHFEEIRNQYQLQHILWQRMHIDQASHLLKDQDLVVFSCYVWNKRYNYALAQAIKELNPNCILIFGGPEMPVTSLDIFQKYPYIDLVIKKEGEITFRDCLLSLDNLDHIPGVLVNREGRVLDTGDPPRIDDLNQLPSPYLSGFFDELIVSNPEVSWMATIETNRGCPYQCSFCDWGSLTYSKIRKFDLQKVFDEIEWISRNRCGAIMLADSNFGIFPERDNKIVDHFVKCRDRHGFPPYWGVSWAKNQRREIINIIEKLDTGQYYNMGLNMSLQTMTEQVLVNIKRKNMHDMTLKEMYQLAEQNQRPAFTELILGLPGETLDSWKETFFKMMRMDVHCYAEVSIAQMLENAEMNLVQKEIYGIQTKEVYDYLSGTHNFDKWRESIHIVTGTRDLPPDEMLQAIVFTWFITTFHMQNFSIFVSRFLYQHQGIDYKDFYDRLFDLMCQDPWFAEQKKLLEQGINTWFETGDMQHQPLSNGIKIHSWNIFTSAAMKIHLDDRYDHVFALVEKALKCFDLSEDVMRDVMAFQKLYVIDLHRLDAYPRRHDFALNIDDVVFKKCELESSPRSLAFDFRYEKKAINKEYVERIFFSRKNDFTKSLVNSVSYFCG